MVFKTSTSKMAQAKARIWPCLTRLFLVRSVAVRGLALGLDPALSVLFFPQPRVE